MSDWTIAPPPGPNSGIEVPLSASATPLYVAREQVIRTPKVAFHAMLTGSTAVLYTAPTLASSPTSSATGTQASSQIRRITVCNTDTSARTYTLTIVESGGSVADNRAIAKAVTIAASTVHIYRYEQDEEPLMEGSTVNGLADTTLKVTVRLTVVDTTH